MLGAQELIIVFLIILVLFGASRLPQLGRGLGEGISNFKRGLKGSATDQSLPADAPEKDEAA